VVAGVEFYPVIGYTAVMSEAQKSSPFYQILQDYADWSSQVLRAVFYPEKVLKTSVKAPASLGGRLQDLSHAGQVAQSVIEDIVERQKTLHAQVDFMLAADSKPDLETFDTFLNCYEDFTERIARFDIDSVLSDFGVDTITGLRSATVIISDLERELERRARRGHPFSIVLCQIDRPDPDNISGQVEASAKAIKACMRNFDDAYLSGKSEILVSLKQTDNAGALRFVERLKEELNKEHADFTMSFCAAEPMPGDDLRGLINNVRSDLQEIAASGEGAGEYEEISSLQRFIKSLKPAKQ
jgi:GGDEF domain-containing protein